jgi:peptidoglycan/LPS O-acetylase OafA/YrhL
MGRPSAEITYLGISVSDPAKWAVMKEIRSLTAMRGIAAMYVALSHFSLFAQQLTKGAITSIAPSGYLAVDFFFVLSGFIMGYTYWAEFRVSEPGAYRRFLQKRFARILPLNTFVVVIVVAIEARRTAGHPQIARLAKDAVANLLMLQGFGVGINLNVPSWSVSVEWAAYLAFPVFIWIILRKKLATLAAIAAIGALIAISFFNSDHTLNTYFMPVWWACVRCLAEFALGLVAYKLFDNEERSQGLGSDVVASMLLVASAVFAVSGKFDIGAALLFPVLIVSLAHNKGRVFNVLSAAPLQFLGLISYSIYMTHYVIADFEASVIGRVFGHSFSSGVALIFVGAGSLSVIAPAYASYRLVEKPGRSLGRRALSWTGASTDSIAGRH